MGLTCGDVMVPQERQLRIHPEESVLTAFNKIKDRRARFLPVVEDDETYVGVFTAPTLLKLILPRAATIGLNKVSTKKVIGNLGFMNLDEKDFVAQLEQMKTEKVKDHLSVPAHIPIATPETPIMEGIFLLYKYKRHVILVEKGSSKFIGTVSANSVLDSVFS